MTNPTTRQSTAAQSLLWVLLTLGAIANAASSAMGLNPLISVAFGLVTLASGVGLVVRYRRAR